MQANARSREILFKELPWMREVLPLDAVEFNVKLVDLDTLSRVPIGVIFSDAGWHQIGRIFFVDAEGKGLGHVGDVPTQIYHRMWSWKKFGFIEVKEDKYGYIKETVEEAIHRLSPRSRNARFIVEFSRTNEASVTIYKVPKRIPDLETWLDQKAAEETELLHNTLEEVGQDA